MRNSDEVVFETIFRDYYERLCNYANTMINFGDIRFIQDKSVASHKVKRVNVDKAWGSVHQKMHSPSVKKTRPIVNMPQWLRVAAVFILLFGVAFWLYTAYFSTFGKAVIIASQNNSINYKLADSSQVVLSKNSKIDRKSVV